MFGAFQLLSRFPVLPSFAHILWIAYNKGSLFPINTCMFQVFQHYSSSCFNGFLDEPFFACSHNCSVQSGYHDSIQKEHVLHISQ